jgi:DNA repair exonuclease SbcCD ATPase subunit
MSRIVKLQVDNLLRLTAVSITPEGDLVIIGGPNAAGKSSVLNAISMALGGTKLVPEVPIHGDEAEGSVFVDLGEFTVTRKFKRERAHLADCGSRASVGGQGLEFIPCNCGNPWGDIKSSLVVRNKDNATYGSPQAMLDKLVGKLAFDPLEFSRAREDVQFETLKKLVNLDLAPIDARRAAAYAERTVANKDGKDLAARIDATPRHTDVPEVEVPLSDISDQMLDAERKRKAAEDLEKKRDDLVDQSKTLDHEMADLEREVAGLQERIKDKQAKLVMKGELNAALAGHIAASATEIVTARIAVPDLEAIRQRLTTVEETNRKVRSNIGREALVQALTSKQNRIAQLNAVIEKADNEKLAALAAVKFPIEGLGFKDLTVTFNGLPLAQASTAEKLRISVAIGIALHPELKVLLIRQGNDLDSKNLAAIAEQASAGGTQIWLEKVAESKEGVTVLIEDGHVA